MFGMNTGKSNGWKNSDAYVNTYLDEQAGPWFWGLPVL